MSIVPTSFNASSVAAEAARLAQLQQGLAPNSVVTASYQFKVANDGTLTATEAKITAQPAAQDDESARQKLLQKQRQSSGGLDDITRPRVQLSPSDELAIFSSTEEEQQSAQPDAQGEQAAGDHSTSEQQEGSSAPLSLEAQAQIKAAGIYARNSDLVYNVNPIVYEAA